jgi:uncharacterized protein (TIGR02996 family)
MTPEVEAVVWHNEPAFVAAIRAQFDDDAPRLVYADWLEEQGNLIRAEYIRAEIAAADRFRPVNLDWKVTGWRWSSFRPLDAPVRGFYLACMADPDVLSDFGDCVLPFYPVRRVHVVGQRGVPIARERLVGFRDRWPYVKEWTGITPSMTAITLTQQPSDTVLSL